MFEKKQEIGLLIDVYGDLLTDNQKKTIIDYYDFDISMSEIAEENNITKQAVKDSIDKALVNFEKLEKVLHLATFHKCLEKLKNEKCKLSAEKYLERLEKILELI